jgi:hypothetical protein
MALDASSWKTVSDFYDALLLAVGAPAWHGRNINALIDSMVFGGINAVEPPYEVRIINTAELSEPINTEVMLVANAIVCARNERLTRTGKDASVSLQQFA